LTGNQSLTEISEKFKLTRKTLQQRFKLFWKLKISPPKNYSYEFGVLIIDGIYLQKRRVEALIGRSIIQSIFWDFYDHENYFNWINFLVQIKEPLVVVCDGQRGMLAAIREIWPRVRIQRCLVHIKRLVRIRLGQNPESEAGIEIKLLVNSLLKVRTRRQKRRWLRQYSKWLRKNTKFIDQKSKGINPKTGKKSWWYTHKNLRSVKSLLNNAKPNLFTFVGHYHEIPRTTNPIEGGTNSRLKELIHRHRGLSIDQKKVLTAVYLSQKISKKPPRNVT
jgi:transposase-like protein